MIALAAIACAGAFSPASVEFVSVAWIGEGGLGGKTGELSGLSGIAPLGHDRWLVVSDRNGVVGELRLVETDDGAFEVTDVSSRRLGSDGDFESVVVEPDGRIVVADERSGSLLEFDLDSGRELRRTPVERVRTHARGNLSLESLARAADGTYWTARERALLCDEPGDDRSSATVVRLTNIERSGGVLREFACEVDGAHADGMTSNSLSGLVDLAALDDGRLLALERSFVAGARPFRSRVYLVDCSNATDVRAIDALADVDVRACEKTLLWEGSQGNLEGLALGPIRNDGSRLLVGVIDDGDPLSRSGLVVFRFQLP